ncbi:MAG: GIY-YIG nuclease family protein [Acidobacteriaceae bacterium]
MGRMDEGGYCTYIMASRSHTLYIGITGDLHRRVFQHKWREHDGFTARYNCDRLVWFERHQDVHLAIAREKELKGWRRAKKITLIEVSNPTWVDLSRNWYDLEPADYRRALDRMDP